jgi:hypothetical protein
MQAQLSLSFNPSIRINILEETLEQQPIDVYVGQLTFESKTIKLSERFLDLFKCIFQNNARDIPRLFSQIKLEEDSGKLLKRATIYITFNGDKEGRLVDIAVFAAIRGSKETIVAVLKELNPICFERVLTAAYEGSEILNENQQVLVQELACHQVFNTKYFNHVVQTSFLYYPFGQANIERVLKIFQESVNILVCEVLNISALSEIVMQYFGNDPAIEVLSDVLSEPGFYKGHTKKIESTSDIPHAMIEEKYKIKLNKIQEAQVIKK